MRKRFQHGAISVRAVATLLELAVHGATALI
jgi:hypothetical protein